MNDEKRPSVTAIVMKLDISYHSVMYERPWVAYLPSNPKMRASGETEDEALASLECMMSYDNFGKILEIKTVEITFDSLLVKEVMEK
jgi:hypothetical protein